MQPDIAKRIELTERLRKHHRRRYTDDDLRPNVGPRVWPAWPIAWLEFAGKTEVESEIRPGVVEYLASQECEEMRIATLLDRYPFLWMTDDNTRVKRERHVLGVSNYCWNEHANGFELAWSTQRSGSRELVCRTFITEKGFRIYIFPIWFLVIPTRQSRQHDVDWGKLAPPNAQLLHPRTTRSPGSSGRCGGSQGGACRDITAAASRSIVVRPASKIFLGRRVEAVCDARREQGDRMSHLHRSLVRRIALAAIFMSPLVAACGINLQSCNCSPPPFTPVNVTTQHNDNFRSGQNLHETILTPFAVRSGRFGRLFSRYVDGQPYAQPLYVHDLDFGNGQTHNVVFSATEANNVYTFDADNPQQRQPYWQSNFGAPYHVDNCDNLQPSVGITSTPVIDIDSRTMYVVAATAGGGPTCPYVQHNLSHQLHAIDLVTGLDKMPPMTICGIVPGFHDGKWFNIHFDSKTQHNRPALLLDHGVVYVAFGSHCDHDPYWGWVFAFDAKTLQPAATPFVTTPNGSDSGGGGSFWQAGNGLAADEDGYVYGMTGNGNVDTSSSFRPSLSESFVKLKINDGVLTIAGYYLDHRHALLNERDKDLGSSGPLLLSLGGQRFVTGGGKEARLYLLNRDTMGYWQGFQTVGTDDTYNILEWGEEHIHGSPVWWNGPTGAMVYLCPEEENLRAYHFDPNTHYDDKNPIVSSMKCAVEMPGGMMSISANGNRGGIVWVNHPYDNIGNDNGDGDHGALSALDATTLEVLWESKNQPQDELGTFAKFSTPTVADGKVFVDAFDAFYNGPSSSGSVVAYGLQCAPPCGAEQVCVNRKCEGCTPAQIAANCGHSCNISDGCGGTCKCGRGQYCDTNPLVIERANVSRARPPGGGGGGGGGPGGPGICEPAIESLAQHCAGKCNTSDGNGGLCGCSAGQSCNPQTQTCCDAEAECQHAAPCKRVCGDSVTCPCASGKCDTNDRCCVPKCDGAKCGAPDGCGDVCFGTCDDPKEICIDDGERRSCQPTEKPCRLKPQLCGMQPRELISRCAADPGLCFVKLGGMHMYRGVMLKHRP